MLKHRSHLHKIKRLHRHSEQINLTNLPRNIIDENVFNQPSKYTKFFDYPLPELLDDHSTDPMQNTTRQYYETISSSSTEGRFANHEMIMRRNGETTILRPKQDLVLVNGFTPVTQPSSLLPSCQSVICHSQVASSLSIMNKRSIIKPEQTSIIRSKRKNRHRRKRCNEIFHEQKSISEFKFSNHNNPCESNFIDLVQQALHEIIDEKQFDNNYPSQQPVPLMSILPQFHAQPSLNHYHQSFTPPLDPSYYNRNTIQPVYFNERQSVSPLMSISEPNRGFLSVNKYEESSYNIPGENYYNFDQNLQSNFDFSQNDRHEHDCSRPSMLHRRNDTHMPGYFFD